MAMATHVIFSAYGFWLPNDPRGSWSDFVRKWELVRFGQGTKSLISGPRLCGPCRARSRAAQGGERGVGLSTRAALPASRRWSSRKDSRQRSTRACIRSTPAPSCRSTCILSSPRHRRKPTQIMGHLKARATRRLRKDGPWFEDDRPVWADRGWKVYLDEPADVLRTIRYVEQNPVKEGKPLQTWSFVTPFPGGVGSEMRGLLSPLRSRHTPRERGR